jgi:hypothetical protein
MPKLVISYLAIRLQQMIILDFLVNFKDFFTETKHALHCCWLLAALHWQFVVDAQ